MKKIYFLCLIVFLGMIALIAKKAYAAPISPQAVANFVIEKNAQPDLVETHPNPYQPHKPWVLVGVQSQTLKHYDAWGRLVKTYVVSTAKRGVGEIENTYQTPRGHHVICEKIGEDAEVRTIIYRREITPWKYSEELHKQHPTKDWILTRIMWLCGQEDGKNKGYNEFGKVVDSYRRFIYIHGSGDHVPFGIPTSMGCVRMQNEEVIELFNQLDVGTDVYIDEHA